jgi:hypothetical protein
MAHQQLIMAIGRIERALSRIEQAPSPNANPTGETELRAKHDLLKTETQAAIADLDLILARLPADG